MLALFPMQYGWLVYMATALNAGHVRVLIFFFIGLLRPFFSRQPRLVCTRSCLPPVRDSTGLRRRYESSESTHVSIKHGRG